jgi:hypothetical protein
LKYAAKSFATTSAEVQYHGVENVSNIRDSPIAVIGGNRKLLMRGVIAPGGTGEFFFHADEISERRAAITINLPNICISSN